MRLVKNGCKVKMGEDTLETFSKVSGPEDLISTVDGQRIPKSIKKKVWLVNIRFPKTLLDVSEDIKDTDDIDYDSIESAYEEELDGEQGLENNEEVPSEEVPT
jgi:hypothetical protein